MRCGMQRLINNNSGEGEDIMHFRKSLFLLSVIGAFVFLSSIFMLQAQAAVKQQQGMDSLPLEGRYAVSAAMGHDSPAYHVRQYSGSLAAYNAGQKLTLQFSAGGVTVGSGNQLFSLRPMLWGYGEELTLLPDGMPQAVGNMVSNSRVSVNEWYVNGPMGLQQGFTVAEKPQGGAGPLKIALALDGARAGSVDADGKGVLFTKPDGSPLYRYSGLVVRDAGGRQADAWLEAKSDMLTICVDDTDHPYPLYIDPIIQTAKLTPSDGAANDAFGNSIAISGDTVVVGAYYDDIGTNANQGSAYVFVKPASGWANMTQTAKLTASDGAANDDFGNSVAISGDTVVVGAYLDDIGTNANQGSAYVFVKPASGWANMTQTAKLTASDGAANDDFGYSVAISGDTVVVGSYLDDIGANTNQGSAYVFVKPASGWADMTQTAKLTASDGAANDDFGYSVAISVDTVAVGAYFDDIGANTDQGSAYVFVKPASGWADMTQTAKLTASDGAADDMFGATVAVSVDTVVVGTYFSYIGTNGGQGSAHVFVKPASGWANMTQTAKLTASDGAAYDYFGFSVAISGDTVVVGACYDDIGTKTNQGSAYVFTVSASTTSTTTQPSTTTSTIPTTSTTSSSTTSVTITSTSTTSVTITSTSTTSITSTVPTTSSSTTTTAGTGQYGDFTYYADGGIAKIVRYTGAGGDVTIPTYINGWLVQYIQDGAFSNCAGVTSVIIPGGVVSIGSTAFYPCTGLNNFYVYPTNAFYSNPGGVLCNKDGTYLLQYPGGRAGGYAIPAGITLIASDAFAYCAGLTSASIPTSVTSIGSRAFQHCTGLISIEVDAGNANFSSQDGVLYNKTKTTLVQYPLGRPGFFPMPDGVTSIGQFAFESCSGLTGVSMADSLTNIGAWAFRYCTDLTSITIPVSTISIQEAAFYGCSRLVGACFYGNAPTMGTNVFYSCASGFTVYYLAGATGFANPWYGYITLLFTDTDTDADGVLDVIDNCPNKYNPQQLDANHNGIGDVCDTSPGCGGCGQAACEQYGDTDGDGIIDVLDNCPNVYNPRQLDANKNAAGDCCDPSPGCGGCGQPECDAVCTL
jgi:hypothetical protein